MPLPFPKYESYSADSAASPYIGTQQFLRAASDIGGRYSVMAAGAQMQEFDDAATGRLLTPEEANDLYAMDGLNFEAPIYEGQAQLAKERKIHDRRMNFIFGAGMNSKSRMVAGMGVSMAASLANPFDVAIGFLPIVGAPSKAVTGAKGAITSASTARRGLIAYESVARLPIVGRFPNTAAAVIEGTIGQAIAEIPVALARRQDLSDYTFRDSVVNIGAAGVLAGSIRAALSGAARAMSRMSEATHRKIMEVQEAQLIEGRPMDATAVIKADADIQRFQAELEERMQKRGLMTAEQRAELESRTLSRIDAEVESRRKQLVASDPARYVNERDLVDLAKAEIAAAKEAGHEASPDIAGLAEAVKAYERAKASQFTTSKKKGGKVREKLREAESRMSNALDDLADVFDLSYRPEVKETPKIFTSLSDRKRFDFTVAKHLPETVRQGLSQANRAEIIRRMGDNQLEARLARGKVRKSQEALQQLDEQFKKQDQEIATLTKQLEEEFAPSEMERKFIEASNEDIEANTKVLDEHIAEMREVAEASDNPEVKKEMAAAKKKSEEIENELSVMEVAKNCIEING